MTVYFKTKRALSVYCILFHFV